MASIGYEYEPDLDELEAFQGEEQGICYSTKLEELDKYDLMNRDSDTLNRVILDTISSNLSQPIEAKTIPPGGLIGDTVKEPEMVTELVEERTSTIETLTREQNKEITEKFEKSKLINMSLEDFIKFVANSYLDIINDLLELNSIKDIPTIFLKNDRLIAIGILLLAIGIFFIFFNQL